MAGVWLDLGNVQAAPVDELPELAFQEFRDLVLEGIAGGARLAVLCGLPGGEERLRLIAVLARESLGCLSLISTVVGREYPSLTPECPQAHLFERELAETWGVTPTGHPWLKPVRRTLQSDFFQVAGAGVHEVAVGPVHAGVIEPGHFRFQCRGEDVLHLEIALGYQHRGVERALVGGPDRRSIHYMETLAGDTSVGHSLCYCRNLEALTGVRAPLRAKALRGIALELERLANHTGDLGALAGDVAFLPTASYCGRIRGDFLNMTALLCGSRLGRGMIRPGGAGFDVDAARVDALRARLETAARAVAGAVELLFNTQSVLARFEETGTLTPKICEDLGIVGVAARACGLSRDVRHEFPEGIYRFFQIPVSTWHTGDVFARAWVRWMEIQRSLAFIRDLLGGLPDGPAGATLGPVPPDHVAVSLAEGWRGEIAHLAVTGPDGRFELYKVVDPSFHNWTGLAMAMREEPISDFPLCNKSFNLSYCGHDL